MNRSFFLFVLLGFSLFGLRPIGQAQSSHASAIFLELGGNGNNLSLNYDRRIPEGNNGLGGRVGLGIGTGRHSHLFPELIPTVLLAANYLLGEGAHQLEAGAGVTIGTSEFETKDYEYHSVVFVPSLGYRYQKPTRGFMLRAVASPLLAAGVKFWAGLSFGIRF